MKAQEQSLDVLTAIEEALALRRPFADSVYIFEQLLVSLKRRLSKVALHLPVAAALLDTIEKADWPLYRIIGDTVVRCAIIHAHIQIETNTPYGLPLAECEKVLDATLKHIQEGRVDSPLYHNSFHRLGAEPYHGWVWSDEHPDDIFGRSFRFLLKERYGAIPVTPTKDEIAMLEQGAKLLQDLLPILTPSALVHAQLITVVPSEGSWKGVASSSQFHLGGTIFLGRSLHSPWWVAEHLLHEALHQKLYDFRHAHSLLELEYAREEAPRVISPWNSEQLNKSNLWDVHRVYAAFHVYVHLSLLAIVAEQRASELESSYGRLHAMMESRKALDRAHYLGEKLKEDCWDELGLAGKKMADWLLSVLQILDPSPPPRGAYIHLCMDLYETEANRVAAALKETELKPSTLPQRLIPLAKDEIASACRLLSAINAQEELRQFNDAVGEYSGEQLGINFPQVRRVIGMTIMKAAANRYSLTNSENHDQLLRGIIEKASKGVFAVLAGYSPAVAEAKRRANELRFTMSCDDHVGHMLAALAAAVPSRGRILEIGTGVGVGTAWIIDGLDNRTDAEVVTIEIQPYLGRATSASAWPEYVQFVVTDALGALESLGSFDLIFADASPIKYREIDYVLRALRPGGMLVVDDLGEPSSSEQQRMDKDLLRRSLMQHPQLHVVDIQWSTGVILATKSMSATVPAIEELTKEVSLPSTNV